MKPLVFQSDFGLVDGAVSAMYGVAYCVDPELKIHDLTHDITPYSIWEASYRLIQTISYWPEDTVFVSVVDPGVGTDRRSIVVRTKSGKYIVTPDNGTLTHVLRLDGVVAARQIDEKINRLPNSGESYTFYGRDVYAYTGARLAAGVISFDQVGPDIPVETGEAQRGGALLRRQRRLRHGGCAGCPLRLPLDQYPPGAVSENRRPVWGQAQHHH